MAHSHKPLITKENEQKTLWVIILTVTTMIAEIIYGSVSHSMALLADGYHMGTHVLALSLTYIAYLLMRHCTGDKFPCGTQKIGTLTAYTSALFLAVTGIWIICEAGLRFFNPLRIHFNEAISVAIIGLIVNVLCIWIMERGHNHQKTDYNFMAAYYHILADTLTSVLAILALLIGKYVGWIRLDPIIGGLGGLLILKWAAGLIKHTAVILIDMKIE